MSTRESHPPPTDQLGRRIERLPLRGSALAAMALAAVSYWFEFADTVAIGAVSKPIRADLGLDLSGFASAISGTYVGLLLGAFGGGWIADRVGRRSVLAAATTLTAVGSLASALATVGLVSLVALRAVTALGMGAVYVVALTYLIEVLPVRRRASAVALAFLVGNSGAVALPVFAKWAIATGPAGWRLVLGVGVLGAVALVWLVRLPESPRWLQSRGRDADAEVAVARLEASAERVLCHRLEPVTGQDAPAVIDGDRATTPFSGTRELFSAANRGPLLLVMVLWAAFTMVSQLMSSWTPTILDLRGFDVQTALSIAGTIALGMLVGALLMVWLGDRLSSARLAIAVAAGAALMGAVYGFAGSVAVIIASGFILYALIGMFGPLLNKIMAELWPAHLRARGNGAAFSAGRVAAIVAPFTVVSLLEAQGVNATGWVLCGLWLIATVAMIVLMRRSTNAAPGDAVTAEPNPAEGDAAQARVI